MWQPYGFPVGPFTASGTERCLSLEELDVARTRLIPRKATHPVAVRKNDWSFCSEAASAP